MPLSIKVNVSVQPGTCVACGKSGDIVLNGYHEGSEDSSGPFCLGCLVSVQHTLILEGVPLSQRVPVKKLKRQSQRQERQIMNDIGGRVQPASGARPGYKSDGRLYDKVRMEAKLTNAKAFSLKRSDLDKVRSECQGHEKPALIIDFKNKSTGRTEDRWAVIEYKEWERIVATTDDS
jgi:hypothetical protein